MGSVHRRFNKANIDALLSLGYQVELCANFANGEGPESENQKFVEACKTLGIKIHSIAFKRHSLVDNLKCVTDLKSLLLEGNFDIIHAHTETGGLLLKMMETVKGKSKFVYTPHGMSFWKGSSLKSHWLYKPLERWICSAMDLNLGMNLEEFQYLKNWNSNTAAYVHGVGLDIHRMRIPNRSRESVREEFGVVNQEHLLISIGELNENKNHITVLRALAKLERKDFHYLVCGSGPNRERLITSAQDLGLKDNLILAGYRPDIPDILNAADIFVFPSYHEGLPVSALEAMACGLPIVCSSIRGNVDLVKNGDNGYLFKPSDDITLSHKLNILMNDKRKCRTMGIRNLEIINDFSLDAVKDELKKIYTLLINE